MTILLKLGEIWLTIINMSLQLVNNCGQKKKKTLVVVGSRKQQQPARLKSDILLTNLS